MFENYFNLHEPTYNDEDLHNLLFKQLIIEAFVDNESQFDKILKKLIEKDVSLFDTLTIYPEYTGSVNNTDIQIERNDSDYGAFLSASPIFIKDEKYLLKLVNNLNREEVLMNNHSMTVFMLALIDNNYQNAFNKILENNLLTEKEIKLNLILPDNLYYYRHQKTKIYTLEIDFLSKHIHELKINKANVYSLNEIYQYVLSHANREQFKSITEIIQKKVDFSNINNEFKKELFQTFLEFGVLQPNQLVGDKYLIENPTIEIKSFLNLSAFALEKIINLQNINLEKRLSENSTIANKEKIKKI